MQVCKQLRGHSYMTSGSKALDILTPLRQQNMFCLSTVKLYLTLLDWYVFISKLVANFDPMHLLCGRHIWMPPQQPASFSSAIETFSHISSSDMQSLNLSRAAFVIAPFDAAISHLSGSKHKRATRHSYGK